MKIFKLPDLGEGLTEAEIHEWHVQEGDTVKLDQTLVSMETAKAVVEVPSPRAGKIIKFYGKPGDVILTGAPLLEYEDGEETKRPDTGTVAGKLQVGEVVLQEPAMGIVRSQSAASSIKALPAARMLANRLGVSLEGLKGSGVGGQITIKDVEAAAHKPLLPDMEALKGVRKSMAIAMTQSHESVVPVTLMDDADIHQWKTGEDITIRLIRAIQQACQVEPALNAWFDGKSMARKLFTEVNLGLALDAKEGLFVPVIKSIASQSDQQLRDIINRFKGQAKERSFPSEELQGATFTLSNFGVFAGKYASPIVVPPMVAILAVGKLREQLIKTDAGVESHRMIPLSLTFDHRAATGGEAARFLQALIEDLQKP